MTDSMLAFGALVVGILTLGATIFIYLRQRTKKRLVYEVITNGALITTNYEIPEIQRIKIYLGERPVKDVKLVVLRFANIGNVPIRSVDIEEEVYLDFGSVAEIINAEVVEAINDSLKTSIELKVNKGRITLSKFLLNDKDWFSLKLLINQFTEALPQPRGRIIGIQDIELSVPEPTTRNERRNQLVKLLISIVLITEFVTAFMVLFLDQTHDLFPFIASFIIMAIFILFLALSARKSNT